MTVAGTERPVAATTLTKVFRHDAESDELLVVFGSANAADEALMRAAFALPVQAIMLMPRKAHGYPPAEAEALRALVAGLASPHRRVAVVGAGLGGHAVLRHARLFNARLAVAEAVLPVVAAGEDMAVTARGIPPDCDAFLLFDPNHPGERHFANGAAAHASIAPVPRHNLHGARLLAQPDTLAAVLDTVRARAPRGSRRRDLSAWLRARAHADASYRAELTRRLLARGHAGWAARLTPAEVVLPLHAAEPVTLPAAGVHGAAPQPTALPASLDQVQALEAAGFIQQALLVARQVVRATPNDVAALVVLAGLLRRSGEIAAADAVQALLDRR